MCPAGATISWDVLVGGPGHWVVSLTVGWVDKESPVPVLWQIFILDKVPSSWIVTVVFSFRVDSATSSWFLLFKEFSFGAPARSLPQ